MQQQLQLRQLVVLESRLYALENKRQVFTTPEEIRKVRRNIIKEGDLLEYEF